MSKPQTYTQQLSCEHCQPRLSHVLSQLRSTSAFIKLITTGLCAATLRPRPTSDKNCLCCTILCFMLPLRFRSTWCGRWPKSFILSESLPQILATNRGRKEGEQRLKIITPRRCPQRRRAQRCLWQQWRVPRPS